MSQLDIQTAKAAPQELVRELSMMLVRAAIRQRAFPLAESELLRGASWSMRDAECLNLFGLIAEHRDDWSAACRFWKMSLKADHKFAAPRTNLRRYYELFTFGRTTLRPDAGERSAAR